MKNMSLKITGKLPSTEQLKLLMRSPHYRDKSFQNLSDTPMISEDASYWKMTKDYFKGNKNGAPRKPLPHIATDLNHLRETAPTLVWFGHSSYLVKLDGKTILTDPVLSGNAAPLSFMVRAFPGANTYKAEDMPYIDYLVLSHDHYDHLDYKTVIKLKDRIGKIYCSLGVGSHLVYWGFNKNDITEMDWWQTKKMNSNMSITAAPARHFSGRGLKRGQTFWSSFILQTSKYNLYLGGDSGYDSHFAEIGNKYGPFDLAILECGQYNTMWRHIHMMPEETAQAAIDLHAKTLLPVHWGKFTLALHDWDEPVKRLLQKSKEFGLQLTTPMIGEPVIVNQHYPSSQWWMFE